MKSRKTAKKQKDGKGKRGRPETRLKVIREDTGEKA
jgi:hypothetical protein